MADNKKQIEDTEELKRVIAELQEKVNAMEKDEAETMSGAAVLAEEEVTDESYVAYRPEENFGDSEPEPAEEVNSAKTNKMSKKKHLIMEEEFGREEENAAPAPAPEVKKETHKKRRKKSSKEEDIIISLENVSKSYVKGIPAIEHINIKIKRGEFVFIVGDSGSGKSTLIRLLLHEIKPTSGKIMVNGFQVDRLRQRHVPRLRRSMGVVFQDFRLLKDRNVYENVAFAQRIIQVPQREMKKNVPQMLKVVGLASKYRAKPSELSGGEQQRVALARALVNKPPILLADEPTGNLDPRNTLEIMNLLDEINKNGTTVIVVTHNDKVVNDMQKRVITIKKGIIVSDEEKGGYIDED